jgi:hypothetical protein
MLYRKGRIVTNLALATSVAVGALVLFVFKECGSGPSLRWPLGLLLDIAPD